MKRIAFTLIFAALSLSAFGQNMTVRVKSKGDDFRKVVAEIFEQTGQQYVIETSARQSLYMSLDGVTLDYAIEAISEIADLKIEKVGGIWRVRSKKPAPTVSAPKVPTPAGAVTTRAQAFAPLNPVKKPNLALLEKKVTTKMERTAIRTVFAAFATQAGVKIEVAKDVPEYKIDAFMYNTSLKFALDRICKAAGLKFEFTDGKTVRIRKA